jgi:hypothetical protein
MKKKQYLFFLRCVDDVQAVLPVDGGGAWSGAACRGAALEQRRDERFMVRRGPAGAVPSSPRMREWRPSSPRRRRELSR